MRTRTSRPLAASRRRSVLALVAALLLAGSALAACGDDDAGDDGDGGTTSGEQQGDGATDDGDGEASTEDGGDGGEDGGGLTDDRTEAELAEDRALAESILLVQGDFPDGWEPDTDDDEDEDDPEQDELDAQLYECVGIERSDIFDNERALAESPDYNAPSSGGEETYAASEVNVYPNEEYARAAFAPFEDPDFDQCFRDLAVAQFEEDAANDTSGVEFNDVSLEPLDFPDLGDGTAGYRVILSISFEGVTIESTIDFVAILVGRVGISLDYGSFGGEFPNDLAKQLANTIVARAESA